MGLKNRTKWILLGVAALLLIAAAVWSVQLTKDDTLGAIAGELNEFGYSLTGEDIYVLGESQNTTIAAVLEGMNLEEAVEASRAAGFPSDIAAAGDIVVLLAEVDAGVLTAYLRDGALELCFVQTLEGEISQLGGA